MERLASPPFYCRKGDRCLFRSERSSCSLTRPPALVYRLADINLYLTVFLAGVPVCALKTMTNAPQLRAYFQQECG